MEIKKRFYLSKKEIKNIKKELAKIFKDDILPKKGLELVITDKFDLILSDKEPIAIKIDDKIFPTINLLTKYPADFKKVIIDMGAIKYLINGADVMIPGIVEIDEDIEEGDVVVVLDEKHKKPICVGIALLSAKEIKEKDKGKAIKNIHYVGDEIWNFKG
ncbi:DUF1947 domain-containing protein [Methanocaldococcus indicus]|uniref:DUF1947 domain-containing protein n=1 Tax=Methanocaldococcus indicus TaxID=213231 RepID=UPI003C6CECE7